MRIEHINDGDEKRKIVVDGVVAGWVEKWYHRDLVNATGVKMFAARPVGYSGEIKHFRSYPEAAGFVLGWAGKEGEE